MQRPKLDPNHSPTLFEMDKPDDSGHLASTGNVERPYSEPGLYLGTSAFTANGWVGSFYPAGMRSCEFLTHYAKTFPTVEIDSTFYGTPSPTTVTAWSARAPDDFVFAAKVPQVITHDKVLVDCDQEFDEFIGRMRLLGEKLGPLVLQFPFFSKSEFKSANDFLPRLRLFLERVHEMPVKFVVEIRNQTWLDERFADVLRKYKIALALTDTSFLPRPWEMKGKLDLVTADFVYVRWLGDRKAIEAQTTNWDRTIIDRSGDLQHWVELFRQFIRRDLRIYAYANNHYAGNGPGTVKLFWDMWKK
ncbi:MAG TPA: DUF72 domain-containing protein [Terriglobales bacterium]|nr:DUF72 domain-containing protein [Terriglobales bacterium]